MGDRTFVCPNGGLEFRAGPAVADLARPWRRTIYLECPHCGDLHGFAIAQDLYRRPPSMPATKGRPTRRLPAGGRPTPPHRRISTRVRPPA